MLDNNFTIRATRRPLRLAQIAPLFERVGFTPNPLGFNFFDLGVGAMPSGPNNPNPLQWKALAPLYNGKFQVPTLRNVDRRPRPDFIKAYMHNGYLKSLAEVVHFYNTSQALPRCLQGSPGEKVSCWPVPETSGIQPQAPATHRQN